MVSVENTSTMKEPSDFMEDGLSADLRADVITKSLDMKSIKLVTNSFTGIEQTIVLIGGENSLIEAQKCDTPKFVHIDTLPQEMKDQLDSFDPDGNEIADYPMMITAPSVQRSMKVQNSFLRKGMMFVGAVAVGLVAVVTGLTYAFVQDSKDTVVVGRALYNKHEEPVGVNMNEIKIPLGAIGFMSEDIPSKITNIALRDENGKIHYRTKELIDVVPKKNVHLKTISGDVISWELDRDSGASIQVSMADGSYWTSPACCDVCSMTSVVADGTVMNALQEFYQTVGKFEADGRHLHSRSYPHQHPQNCPCYLLEL